MWLKELIGPIGWLIAAIVSLGVWRYQLISKRRYEVAEEALSTAHDFVKALHSARVLETQDTAPPLQPDQLRPDPVLLSYSRLQSAGNTVDALDAASKSISMHFGEAAQQPFGALRSIYNELWAAHTNLFQRGLSEKIYPSDDQRAQWAAWRTILYRQPEGDLTSARIDDAFIQIRTRFGKYLRPSRWRLFLPSYE